jgi:hypothetical protein
MRGVDGFLRCKIRGVDVVSTMQNSWGSLKAYAAFRPLNFGAILGEECRRNCRYRDVRYVACSWIVDSLLGRAGSLNIASFTHGPFIPQADDGVLVFDLLRTYDSRDQ